MGALAALACCALAACGKPTPLSPADATGTGGSRDSAADAASGMAGASGLGSCADVVVTPGGLIARQCVHQVPDGAAITTDSKGVSTVTLNGAVVATYPPCPCGPVTLGSGGPPGVDAAADGSQGANDATVDVPTQGCRAGCLCATAATCFDVGCYRVFSDQADGGLGFAFCSNGPPLPQDGGTRCTYADGGSPGQPSDFSNGCPSSGCPAGTVCVGEVGGIAGGGGAYCAPIPVECHGTPTCACMSACACRSGVGFVPEVCSESASGLSCDNRIR
jgi:hypothetical protein